MKDELFLVDEKGKWFGYTKLQLEGADFVAVAGSKVPSEKLVGFTQEAYAKQYGNQLVGVWIPYEVKEEWLDEDNQKVEATITEKKAPFTRHGERWEAVVAVNGYTEWNFDKVKPEWVKSEVGLSKMPFKLASLVKNIAVVELYGENNDPLYQMPSSQS